MKASAVARPPIPPPTIATSTTSSGPCQARPVAAAVGIRCAVASTTRRPKLEVEAAAEEEAEPEPPVPLVVPWILWGDKVGLGVGWVLAARLHDVFLFRPTTKKCDRARHACSPRRQQEEGRDREEQRPVAAADGRHHVLAGPSVCGRGVVWQCLSAMCVCQA